MRIGRATRVGSIGAKEAGFTPDFEHWGEEREPLCGMPHKVYLLHRIGGGSQEENSLSVHEFDFGNMKPTSGGSYQPLVGTKRLILIQASARMDEVQAHLLPIANGTTTMLLKKDLEKTGWSAERGRYLRTKVGDTSFARATQKLVHGASSTEVDYLTMDLDEVLRGKKIYCFGGESHGQGDDRKRLTAGLKKHAR